MDVMNKHGIQMIKVKSYEKENESIKDTTCCRVGKTQDFVVVVGVLGNQNLKTASGSQFVSVLQPCITHHTMKIVLKYRTLFKKKLILALFILGMLKDVWCQLFKKSLYLLYLYLAC